MAGQPERTAAVLSRKLAPWLSEPLARLERARQTERLGHGWLVTGPAGVGKLNLALVFAQRLLSGTREEPATLTAEEALPAFRARHEPADHHPDLHPVFPVEDRQTIGVDQIREVSELLSLKGFSGSAKVVVIDPAEAMTGAAANALLKTLEEPTADTYLLLVSHRPGRLPPTIRSRCQQLTVAAPAGDAAARWLGDDVVTAAPAGAGAALTPFQRLDAGDKDTIREINELQSSIEKISRSELDPQIVAERWLKCDLERLLSALAALLQQHIRARFLERGSNSVTVRAADVLHNPSGRATLKLLFDQLDAAERLRDQLGGGINVELAVKVLLSGFKPE